MLAPYEVGRFMLSIKQEWLSYRPAFLHFHWRKRGYWRNPCLPDCVKIEKQPRCACLFFNLHLCLQKRAFDASMQIEKGALWDALFLFISGERGICTFFQTSHYTGFQAVWSLIGHDLVTIKLKQRTLSLMG